MRYLFLTLLISVSLFACKKKEPPLQTTSTPIFKFIGRIGNDSVNYQAGVNAIYMYTGFYKDSQNLLTVRSYFGKDNCTNCEPYLSFEVKDFDVSNTNGLAGTIADLLKGGGTFNSYSLDSILTSTTVEMFRFIPEANSSVSYTYKWNFGDGGTSTTASPIYMYSGGGLRNVQLIRQGGGSIDTLVNSINTDFHASCRLQFMIQKDTLSTPGTVYVNAFPPGFAYSWNYGDGQSGQGITDTNIYALSGKYTITLTANSPSCSSAFKQKVNTSFIPMTLANYTYTTTDTMLSMLVPRINKSAFIITWKKNNNIYKSYKNMHGVNQSGNPVFTFTGILPYQNNEHGNKTVLVTGTVDTYLYNQSNSQDSIHIKSDQVVLAAAYPD